MTSDFERERTMAPILVDVHYILSPPSISPPHHAFEKGSHVYLRPANRQSDITLEILNRPGTEEQNSVSGFIHSSRLDWSHEHPTLISLAFELGPDANTNAASSMQNEKNQWQLLTLDQRNESKHSLHVHAIDLYIWTEKDAIKLLEVLKRGLPVSQVQLTEAKASQPENGGSMSPVVQKLEHAAISDPAYGQKDGSNMQSITFPPPPPSQSQDLNDMQPKAAQDSTEDYKPLAYNPAAPAAPEPIRYREKTPPPPDGDTGTGLNAAFAADQNQTYAPPPLQQSTSYPPPPPPNHQLHYGDPPQRQPSFGPGAAASSPPPLGSTFGPPRRTSTFPPPPPPPQSTSSAGPPPGQQYAHSFSPPPQTPQDPNAQPQSQMNQPLHSPPPQSYASPYGQPPQQNYFQQQSTQQQQAQPQQYNNYAYTQPVQSPPIQSPPPGGYSSYQYGQSQPQQSQSETYSVHNQVYKPTESEASAIHQKHSAAGPGQQPGRLEGKADKVGKAANRFLKKLEKKI